MKYGRNHGNYQHGGACGEFSDNSVQISAARDLLRKVLSTPCDSGGRVPYTNEEAVWAFKITQERPDWAIPVLTELGFKEE